jgi:hypothetical protein
MIEPEHATTLTFGTGAQKAIGFTSLDPADSTRCNSNQLAPGPNLPLPLRMSGSPLQLFPDTLMLSEWAVLCPNSSKWMHDGVSDAQMVTGQRHQGRMGGSSCGANDAE